MLSTQRGGAIPPTHFGNFGNDLTVLLKSLILVAAHGPAALINLPLGNESRSCAPAAGPDGADSEPSAGPDQSEIASD
jgi:hypothetical protein